MSDPDMGSWSYVYDKMGNLVLQVDAKAQAIAFEYDGLNRMTRKHYCETFTFDPPGCAAIDHSVEFAYDEPSVPNSKGKLTSVSDDQNGNYDYVTEYDLFQRVKGSHKVIGADSASFEKRYDSAGRVVRIKYLAGSPFERVYDYEYDVAGNLLYVQESGSVYPLVAYSDFTALGQPGLATFPKSATLSVTTSYRYYPKTGRLHTLVTERINNGQVEATYQDLTYAYDGLGNILQLDDGVNLITHHYSYDHLNRLTLANGVGTNPYSESYAYDRIGNILSKTDAGNDYRYTIPNKPHAVREIWNSGVQRYAFSYDSNGNMTQKRDLTGAQEVKLDLVYNYDNRPVGVQKTVGQTLTTMVTFIYDGNGQRVAKVNQTGQSTRTTYYFGELYEEREGVGDFIHVFAGNRRVATVPVGVGCTRFYHPNHLGSASVVTREDGQWTEKIEYFPFGSYRVRQDNDGDCLNVHYTFTDQEDEEELGLYNYGARLYDPLLGKFISPDAIVQAPEDPQTLNRYSYARNNPIVYTDPTGNFFIIDDLVAVLIGTAIGSIIGGTAAAIQGGDILKGMAMGAVSGAFMAAAGPLTYAGDALFAVDTFTTHSIIQASVYAGLGAAGGATNARIAGGNGGIGALSGGLFSLAGGVIGVPNIELFDQSGNTFWSGVAGTANRLLSSSVTGAGYGAAYAGMTGGHVLKGAGMGALGWAAGEATGMLIGHAGGFIASGGKGPTFESGAFIYDANTRGFITFSNVIIGPADYLYDTLCNVTNRTVEDAMGRTFRDHEMGHTYSQATAVGPGYIPAHIASLTVGGIIGVFTGYGFMEGTHRFGLLERFWHPVPYPVP